MLPRPNSVPPVPIGPPPCGPDSPYQPDPEPEAVDPFDAVEERLRELELAVQDVPPEMLSATAHDALLGHCQSFRKWVELFRFTGEEEQNRRIAHMETRSAQFTKEPRSWNP